jgi:flavodoxin
LEHPFLKSKTTQSTVSNTNVLVVYGTCSGNAEVVSEAIRDGLCDAGLNVELKKAELTKAEISKEYGLIVLVSSTWDVGKLNLNFIGFDRDFKTLDLSNHYVAVVGLGDSKNYDVFCGAADIMEESVKKTKAETLVSTLRIDGEVYSKLDEFRGWGKHLGEEFLGKVNK